MDITRINGYGPDHECWVGGGHEMGPPRMRSVHASSNSAQAEVLSVIDGFLQLRVPSGDAVWVWSHEPWTADAGAPVTVGEVVQLHAADVVSDGDVSWVRAVTRVDEFDAGEARRIASGLVRRCGECGQLDCDGAQGCPWLAGDFYAFELTANMGDGRYVVGLGSGMARIVERDGVLYPAQRLGTIAAMGHAAYWEDPGDADLEEIVRSARRDPQLDYGPGAPRRERRQKR